ncbi:hypothetical protein OCU04_003794 [Sclerotinia nivalis]|uniref:Uncharacterized protein n=1 Tax=Sclerotinia nivalis TaxID=352851 RepID=A0A9X0ASN0_9HELO|nr:hypothetical protein OCU04_003794 [Sclerotinia nivalis]
MVWAFAITLTRNCTSHTRSSDLTTVPVTLLSFINHKYDSAISSSSATCFVKNFFPNSPKIAFFCSSPNPSHNFVFTAPGLRGGKIGTLLGSTIL